MVKSHSDTLRNKCLLGEQVNTTATQWSVYIPERGYQME